MDSKFELDPSTFHKYGSNLAFIFQFPDALILKIYKTLIMFLNNYFPILLGFLLHVALVDLAVCSEEGEDTFPQKTPGNEVRNPNSRRYFTFVP
jgi:hypothetical protein